MELFKTENINQLLYSSKKMEKNTGKSKSEKYWDKHMVMNSFQYCEYFFHISPTFGFQIYDTFLKQEFTDIFNFLSYYWHIKLFTVTFAFLTT